MTLIDLEGMYMEPNEFIHEVYRRMQERYGNASHHTEFEEVKTWENTERAVNDYRRLLPANKDAAILDIGFGTGWFLAACIQLGYTNLHGAEFGPQGASKLPSWSNHIRKIDQIQSNIGDYLSDKKESYDFIHMSHVIEHIPKHSLFYISDSLYWALKSSGTLLLRCPNMEGPTALTSHFVTLGHEYGFTSDNLESLLELSNFDNVEFKVFPIHSPTKRQIAGMLLRKLLGNIRSFSYRVYSGEYLDEYRRGIELIVTAKKTGMRPSLFDKKYF